MRATAGIRRRSFSISSRSVTLIELQKITANLRDIHYFHEKQMVPIVTNIVPYRFSSVVIKDSSRVRKPIAASWFNGCPTRMPKPLSLIMFECRLTLEPQLVQKTKIYISVNYGKSFTYSYLMC